ncbi:MAG: hypothetical protein IJB97_05045 [Clostridia bacterium]|nr:hypothetical protein [Clostridia bacterium]
MNKKMRKTGFFSALALSLCAFFAGVGALGTASTVLADSVLPSMSAIVGKKTDNVTVTAAAESGDYNGLLVSPSKGTDEWSAELDTTFTDSAVITYLLPDRFSIEHELGNDYKRRANAFSVKNADNEIVATFVIMHEHWSSIGDGAAYMYNAVDGTYWVPYHHWNGANSLDYYATPNATQQLYPNGEGKNIAYIKSLSAMYISPISGTDKKDVSFTRGGKTSYLATENFLDDDSLEGTLTFDYANGVLTVKTSTYDVTERGTTLATATGNGQTLTMGTVNADLSDGFTVVMHNAPDFGNPSDSNYYEHTYSSSVLLTSINGFDTLAPEVSVTETTDYITYAGETVVDGKNVIKVLAGEKLDSFTFTSVSKVADKLNATKTLTLNGKGNAVAFAYSDNKAFTEDKTITVTYGGQTKEYLVDVSLPTIKTIGLIESEADDVLLVEEKSFTYADNTYTGLGLEPSSLTSPWNVKINGTFLGDSSITYLGYSRTKDNGVYQANSFTVLDSEGKTVCVFVIMDNHWGSASYTRAYLYNVKTNVYTAATTTWKSVDGLTADDHWVLDSNGNYSIQTLTVDTTNAAGVKSTIGNGYNKMFVGAKMSQQFSQTLAEGGTHEGTVYFEYDEATQTLTVKSSTLLIDGRSAYGATAVGNGQIVPFGSVQHDLSKGYSVVVGSAPSIVDGENTFNYAASSKLLLTKINGVSLAGETVEATGADRTISVNGEKVIDNQANVKFGSTVEFTANNAIQFGSLEIGNTEISVDGEIDTTILGAHTVKVTDLFGSKDVELIVNGMSGALDGTAMSNGASVRSAEPYGLRFTMEVSAADKALIDANVGEGKAYSSVNYGIVIMPYSYVATYGDVTAESLFGENAVYTWKDKDGAGTVEVLEMQTKLGLRLDETTGDYYLQGAITNLAPENVTKQFIGVGYVELTTADGEKEYKVVSLYDGYEENGDNSANNVRSAYDVAKVAYEQNLVGETFKTWLLEKYLLPNGYTVA